MAELNEWRYKGLDPADLKDVYSVELLGADGEPTMVLRSIHADLLPGKTFIAPADWKPVPEPHPLFELVGPYVAPVEDKVKPEQTNSGEE